MRTYLLPISLSALMALTACGVEAPPTAERNESEKPTETEISTHAECVNQESTQEYSDEWQEELSKSKQDGYVDTAEHASIRAVFDSQQYLIGEGKYSEFCGILDQVRDDEF